MFVGSFCHARSKLTLSMNIKNKTKKTGDSKNVCHMSKKGFSLIEVLIAIFIFILTITMLAGSFSSFFKNYTNSKKMQKDVENAQYAMNLMAKTIRTSSVPNASGSMGTFRIFDYSHPTDNCIEYKYASSMITVSSVTKTDPTECNAASMPAAAALTSNNITGAYVLATPTSGSTLGKVTVVLSVQDQSSTVNKPYAIPIQMSVSLRQ